ncbi:B9 domain-containing protein 1 [Plutella xylostella]|uniref:B9 domain-containing protein 1 n=1 Tax=Plutella xylostella TaxID=51655 RepID=UPI002032270A|nr:B9 domain-containing protein 1 [Plutella xylostella]
MRDSEVTHFLVSISGQIEFASFPAGVFDEEVYVQYEFVWGPDWAVKSGLTSGVSQMARPGSNPETVIFNMPVELVFSSTNVSGWPQIILTVRAKNMMSGDSLRGYALALTPPTAGVRQITSPLLRPRAATMLGEWLAWATGQYPELADPKMLASGKDNYLLRTESYGSITMSLSMISKDLRKLGYDNQPPAYKESS